MRRQYSITLTVGAMLILISCSSPKYTYNFDHYDYNSGRKGYTSSRTNEPLEEPLKVDGSEVIAGIAPRAASNTALVPSQGSKSFTDGKRSLKDLSGSEKRQLRKELKDHIRNHGKKLKSADEGASVNATKELDDDLKLAIIFGAIGITFAILGGINTVFWVIGVIGLIVGLVFFIRWISTQ